MQNRILYRAGLALASFFLAVFVFMPKAFPVLAEDSGMSWSDLQTQIDAIYDEYGDEGGTITLTGDLTADAEDAALNVPAGFKVTIDLNGYTIDRHRASAEENGSVIINNGQLTIVDSAGHGKITGGNTTGNGGGIVNTATLNLNGGTVTGNIAEGDGGGVYNNFQMRMDGGTISGNEAGGVAGGVYTIRGQRLMIYNGTITDNEAGETAGGVWYGTSGTRGVLIADGKVTIKGNTVDAKDNNVYLQSGGVIDIGSNFSKESLIGITTEAKPEPGVAVNITRTIRDRGTAANFVSDDETYGVFKELEDEAKLVVPITITFESGDEAAEGTMEPVTAGNGIEYTLPESGFDLNGGSFAGWKVDDGDEIVSKGEKLVFDKNTTLTAAWDKSPWKALQSKIDHALDGETIVLDPDKQYIAADDDSALHVAAGKEVILDLNGCTIDRNLTESDPRQGGYVIGVAGKLTVKDSSEGESGQITGGNAAGNNTGSDAAGGILVSSGGDFTLQSGTITGNTAPRGGGIQNNRGTVTIEGGTITGNTAASIGGGIDSGNGTLNIKGGTISGNTAGQIGGGVCASTSGTYISGSPVISDNTAKGKDHNVYLSSTANTSGVLHVDGELGENAEIHVTHPHTSRLDTPVKITDGLPDRGTIDAFVSDEGCYKGYDADGELVFGKNGATVSFDANGASGTMDDIEVCKDSYLVLPKCGYTPADGYTFMGWKVGTETYQPKDRIQITKDVTLAAQWKEREWSEPTYEWASDYSSVTATRIAKDDSSVKQTETVSASAEETKAATCTETGEIVYTSEAFENEAFQVQTKTVVIDALGHEPAEDAVIENEVKATCTEDGSYDRVTVCIRCGTVLDTKHETTHATGHDWGEWAVITPATCEEKGIEARSCNNDPSHSETREIDALGHKWGEWEVDVPATETEEGTEIRTCENDSAHTQTRSIPILNHVHYVSKVEEHDPTCSTEGNIEYYVCSEGDNPCERCFIASSEGTETIVYNEEELSAEEIDIEETVTPAIEHSWDEGVVDPEPTCTLDGVRTFTCTECGATKEEVEGKTLHDNDYEDEIIIEPTCEKSGYHWHVLRCQKCGESMTRWLEKDDPLGHDWGEWKRLDDKQHQRICKRDPSHKETAAHSWDKGTVTTKPTDTKDGVKTYTCADCGAKKTEVIHAKGYEPGKDPNQKGKDGTPVGPGASEAAADKAITGMTSDTDPAGAVFSKLKLKSTKQTKNSIQLKWTKLGDARKYIIYGNKCGKGIKPQKLATVTGSSTKLKKVAGKNLKKGTYYKFIIVALDKNNNVVSTSKLIHVATKGGKVGNHKSVTVKKSVLKKAKKLKKGKSLKLKAKAVKASKLKVKKHVAVRYESTNSKVATVSKKGVVKAKGKGSCYVYAYAQNGVAKKIKVKVR